MGLCIQNLRLPHLVCPPCVDQFDLIHIARNRQFQPDSAQTSHLPKSRGGNRFPVGALEPNRIDGHAGERDDVAGLKPLNLVQRQ